MLAEHLARLKAREVRRMARDPAVDQAIRNYLAIAARALQVPGYMGQLLSPGGGGAVAHVLGDHAGLGRELGHTMLTEHDPASLTGLLDLLMEHGIDPAAPANSPATTTQLHSLARLLDVLHHNIAGHGTPFSPGPHPVVVRGYGQEGLGQIPIKDMVRRSIEPSPGTATNLFHILRSFGQLVGTPPRYRIAGMDSTVDMLATGDPLGAVHAHRLLGHAQNMPHAGTRENAAHAQTLLQNLLEQVHPALWHYGETGQLPQ